MTFITVRCYSLFQNQRLNGSNSDQLGSLQGITRCKVSCYVTQRGVGGVVKLHKMLGVLTGFCKVWGVWLRGG